MRALLRRLWHAFFYHPEYVQLPPKNPAEEAYDIRGPAKDLITDHKGNWIKQTQSQLEAAEEYGRFVLAVGRALGKGTSPAVVASKAAKVWHGLEDLE